MRLQPWLSLGSPLRRVIYPPSSLVPPWVTTFRFLAVNREPELKPTTFSSLLLFRVFQSFGPLSILILKCLVSVQMFIIYYILHFLILNDFPYWSWGWEFLRCRLMVSIGLVIYGFYRVNGLITVCLCSSIQSISNDLKSFFLEFPFSNFIFLSNLLQSFVQYRIAHEFHWLHYHIRADPLLH